MQSANVPQLVVTSYPFAPDDRQRLEDALGAGSLLVVKGREALRDAVLAYPETDVVCGFAPPADLLDDAPHVRWIALPSAGADSVLRAGLVRPDGPVVTTANGIHAVPIGEFTLSLMLMWVRQWPRILALQRTATWPDRAEWRALEGRELCGATVGIIGLGSIGRYIAQLARGFGMRVVATRRTATSADADPDADMLVATDRLGDLLAASDFVVVSVPLTPQTHHIVGAGELRQMRRTAFLINISRGSTVDEAALVAALRDGTIAGAGLDVFETEPLPAESPLWGMPNVILSPHLAGDSNQYSRRFTDLFLENIAHFRAGEPLRNVVNLARGY